MVMHNTAPDVAVAIAASAVTIAGFATGLHYDVLLAGFTGALVALSYTERRGLWHRLWSLFTASLAAGYMAPALAAYGSQSLPGSEGTQAALISTGFVVGMSAQVLVPGVINWIKRKLEVAP